MYTAIAEKVEPVKAVEPTFGAAINVGKHKPVNPAIVRDMVRAVVMACGKDATLPVLSMVRVRRAGDKLSFTATDRYRMHEAVLTLNKHEDEPTVDLLDKGDGTVLVEGKALFAALKTMGDWGTLTVSAAGVSYRSDGASWTVPAQSFVFPRAEALWPRDEAVRGELAAFSFNPAYLAETAKACQLAGVRHGTMIGSQDATNKPALFGPGECEDGWSFRALLMPVRHRS